MMPFYGRFEHLKEAVGSVLAQSDPDWRLVVIDDLYPDLAPGDWVKAIDDPRVEYIRNPTNLGVSRNFRKATELATASHLVIMGCDDVMGPGYVSRVKSLLARFPEVSLVQPGVAVIDEDGARVLPLADRVKRFYRVRGPKPSVYGGQDLAASLTRGNWTYFPSLCWRTDLFEKHQFRLDIDVVLDLALQLEIIIDGGTMLVDDDEVFLYRRHSTSVSSSKAVDGSRFAQERALFATFAGTFTRVGWIRAARAARFHLSSRLNALSKLPQAFTNGGKRDKFMLLSHVFGTIPRAGS
jgi:glycosyltransferase involved in cell wall biosynthesis